MGVAGGGVFSSVGSAVATLVVASVGGGVDCTVDVGLGAGLRTIDGRNDPCGMGTFGLGIGVGEPVAVGDACALGVLFWLGRLSITPKNT